MSSRGSSSLFAMIALTVAECVTSPGRAESVRLSVAGDPSNVHPDRSAMLSVGVSITGAADRQRALEITLCNLDVQTRPISRVSIHGGPISDGRLVSCTGTRQIWGTPASDADAPGPTLPLSAPGWWTGASTQQTLTWRFSIEDGVTLGDVIAAITGTPARASSLWVGFEVSEPGRDARGPGADSYHANLLVTIPLPRSALVGVSTLAGVMGLGYLRRRGHMQP